MAKILVVDDFDLVLTLTREVLTAEGHNVEATGDTAALVERVTAWQPDIVIIDIVMPTAGTTLIHALRSSGYRGRIIAMSGGGESSPGVLLSRALDMGADECVPKPFHRADLLAKVNSLLNAERRAEPP